MIPENKAFKNESKKYSHFFLKIFDFSVVIKKMFCRFALPIRGKTVKVL